MFKEHGKSIRSNACRQASTTSRVMCVEHNSTSAEENFGAQVRLAREARGWSQESLGRRLREKSGIGVDQAAIARLEKGKRAIRLNEASALAALLGIDLHPYSGSLSRTILDDETYELMRQQVDRYRQTEQEARDAMIRLNEEYGAQVVALQEKSQTAFMARAQIEPMLREYEARRDGDR